MKKKGHGKYSRENHRKANPTYMYPGGGLIDGKCHHTEKEWCIEPLTFGDYNFAEYDLEQNLLKPKERCTYLQVTQKMVEVEKESGGKFVARQI